MGKSYGELICHDNYSRRSKGEKGIVRAYTIVVNDEAVRGSKATLAAFQLLGMWQTIELSELYLTSRVYLDVRPFM